MARAAELMKIRKSSGLSTQPCGTPYWICCQLEQSESGY